MRGQWRWGYQLTERLEVLVNVETASRLDRFLPRAWIYDPVNDCDGVPSKSRNNLADITRLLHQRLVYR